MYSYGVLYTLPTVTFSSLSSRQSYNTRKHQINLRPRKTLTPKISCSAIIDDGGGTKNWEKWLPKNVFSAEKVLKSISEATSSPICQFISSPTSFLHTVDPRIKLAWLVVLVVLPARTHILMRFGLVAYLSLLSILILPRHVWMDQLGRVTLLSAILFIMLGLGADGVPPVVQLRTPPPSMIGLPNLPSSLEGYSYIIMKLGPLQLTRKGLSVASTSACLTFTIFQSASLCLSTTTPEQLAFALQWYLRPLAYIGVPVAEVILTLLLSLRFINLVFDEVRVVALGIVSRRIYWEKFTVLETIEGFPGLEDQVAGGLRRVTIGCKEDLCFVTGPHDRHGLAPLLGYTGPRIVCLFQNLPRVQESDNFICSSCNICYSTLVISSDSHRLTIPFSYTYM